MVRGWLVLALAACHSSSGGPHGPDGGPPADASGDAVADGAAGGDQFAVPSCGMTPGTSHGSYSGVVTLAISGTMSATVGSTLDDPFYALDINNPSHSLGAANTFLRYSRAAGDTCQASAVSTILAGSYPGFTTTHAYTVQIDLGTAAASQVRIGIGDCTCGDNNGMFSAAITP